MHRAVQSALQTNETLCAMVSVSEMRNFVSNYFFTATCARARSLLSPMEEAALLG